MTSTTPLAGNPRSRLVELSYQPTFQALRNIRCRRTLRAHSTHSIRSRDLLRLRRLRAVELPDSGRAVDVHCG